MERPGLPEPQLNILTAMASTLVAAFNKRASNLVKILVAHMNCTCVNYMTLLFQRYIIQQNPLLFVPWTEPSMYRMTFPDSLVLFGQGMHHYRFPGCWQDHLAKSYS